MAMFKNRTWSKTTDISIWLLKYVLTIFRNYHIVREIDFAIKSNNIMVEGNQFWNDTVLSGMGFMDIGGSSVYTYREIPSSFYHLLVESAAKFPEKTAIVTDEGIAYSFGSLLVLTNNFAGFLKEKHALALGSRVGIVFYNSIEFCISLFALSRLGAVAVILPNKYRQPELAQMVTRVKACLVLCDPDFGGWFDETGIPTRVIKEEMLKTEFANAEQNLLPPAGTLDSDSFIFFTSGTTTQSKTVLLKNFNVMHAVLSYQKILKITRDDISIIPIPIYTVTGSIAILGLFVYAGGKVFLHKKFNAIRVMKYVIENDITFIHASPTVFSLLLDEKEKFPSVPSIRAFACGSSNMPKENIRRLKEWMPVAEFYTVYGLTENSSPATIMPTGAADSPFIGSSGLPIPGVAVKIIAPDEKELPPNEIGEIALKGSVVIERYLLGGETSFTKDGFLKTGDVGYLNSEGYLFVVDRIKDMINRGGEKIWSFDVENALHSISGIMEAAVVGIPDQKYGEIPVAMVRLEKSYCYTEDQIKGLLKDKLAGFMIPVKICFVESLLKTANGKVDKKAIRLWFTTGSLSKLRG
jgi:fatty-acyl-CoA synthase/long-chain acyl-CoA synthetase